ncbi:MAG: PspC domain-containing protein [Planctomycetes bacterium]|nr:PspC domain-containing protein [Planctomycetota bacterium]
MLHPAAPLRRNMRNRQVAGVCSGLADHFGLDPTLIRVAYVVAIPLSAGTALAIYCILWLVIPESEY